MCIHKYTVHTVYSSQYILFSIQMLQPSSTMVYRVYSLQFTVTTAQQEQTATLLPHYSRNGSWFFSKNYMHFAHAFLAQTTRRPKPAFSSGKCMFFECFLHVQPYLLKFEEKSGNMHFGPAPLDGEKTHFPRENACFWISSMHFWFQALEGQNMHFPRKKTCFLHVATWILAFWGKPGNMHFCFYSWKVKISIFLEKMHVFCMF